MISILMLEIIACVFALNSKRFSDRVKLFLIIPIIVGTTASLIYLIGSVGL